MKTSLEIINRMTLDEAKKIELKKQESQLVELALVDEIKKSMNKALSEKNAYSKMATSIITQLDALNNGVKIWNKSLVEAQSLISNLVIKAKEIGVETPKEVLNYENVIKEGISDTVKYQIIISKMKNDLPKQ
jgi:hypothetical protein